MWWMVDAVMLAPFVCIFIIIYFMPEEMAIVYPVCFASIFSSFGCIYVAAYICDSLQDRYRAQALEKQQAYYKDRLRDEERVRSIYHDIEEPPSGPPGPDRGQPGPPPGCPGSAGSIGGL